MKSFILFILITCSLAVILSFSASNDQAVVFNYLIAQDTIKLSYLLFGAFISGVLFSGLIMFSAVLKLKLSIRRMKGKTQRQSNELEKLRTIAVKE